MLRPLLVFTLVAAAFHAGGCGTVNPLPPPAPNSGGDTTVFNTSKNAFGFSLANLPAERSDPFHVGNAFFNTNWVASPASTKARDGLGPLFNARSCSACHLRDGRGRPPEPGKPPVALLIRVSVRDADGKSVPHPVYGGQIQNFGLLGVPAEARVQIDWEESRGRYGDGTPYTLIRPRIQLRDPGYGPLGNDVEISPRLAPALIGLGLLAAIPESDLSALADPKDRDGDGVSGRIHRLGDGRLGRFGWKASQPTVARQVAAAFVNDIGITSSVFPAQNHTEAQAAARAKPNGGEPEIEARIFDAVVFYMHALAVPGRRRPADPTVRRGQSLFREARCDACHHPTFRTGPDAHIDELAHQTIHPYTDLLLHDMGEGLADHRPDADANGREWRTPPLWGIGLTKAVNGHTRFLHDGRARNLAEAILWHGGEAEAAREAFRRMSRRDREALLAFLEDL